MKLVNSPRRPSAGPGSSSTPVELEPLITREQAATILGIAVRTLQRLVAEREIPMVRIGRIVRFRPSDIRAFTEKHLWRP